MVNELAVSTSEVQNPQIMRKEEDTWLSFDTITHRVRNLGNISLDGCETSSNVIRVIENEPVEGAMSAPLKLFVSVSNKCNLECSHCMSTSSSRGDISLSVNSLMKIADEAADMGVFLMVIGGGEPLIYNGIWDVISHIRSLDIGVSLTSNGLVIRDSDVDNLLTYGIRTNISLDGTPKTHDRIRNRKGAYAQTVSNIKRLLDGGVKPTIRFTLLNSNLEDVDHMIELANGLGVSLKSRRAKPSGRVLFGSDIITEPSNEYFSAVIKLNAADNCGVEDLFNLDSSTKEQLLLSDTDCGAGTRIAYIDEDGLVSPCIFLGKNFVSGKWEPGKLATYWKSAEEFKKMRNIPQNSVCNSCERQSICHIECPAMRLHVGGELNAQDPGCIKPIVQYLENTTMRKNV